MICRICGCKEIADGGSGKCSCTVCKGFFRNPTMPERACSRCGTAYVTLPAVEDPVLDLVLLTPSNVKTYWRKTQCPACIATSIREAYVQKYQKDWSKPPLDWWGKTDEATISFLVKWSLDKGQVTVYKLRHVVRLPQEFIDYCLALGED